jgi:hypothetical protein
LKFESLALRKTNAKTGPDFIGAFLIELACKAFSVKGREE